MYNADMNIKKLLSVGSQGVHATKNAVRERDKHTCQMCGRKRKEGGRQLDVHHLDEEFEGSKEYREDHEMDKMVTLCHKCHLNLPHIRKKVSEAMKKTWEKRLKIEI